MSTEEKEKSGHAGGLEMKTSTYAQIKPRFDRPGEGPADAETNQDPPLPPPTEKLEENSNTTFSLALIAASATAKHYIPDVFEKSGNDSPNPPSFDQWFFLYIRGIVDEDELSAILTKAGVIMISLAYALFLGIVLLKWCSKKKRHNQCHHHDE
ncbi:hypothetical protein L2E82_14813 [Cichorium intybus]|uniref:Uncharacterized protein n=1 Tax=Cichorium intybus TaxID=13427 RepID=A0ACB9F136_CICIN|nr:hypothetical protein L2E82_14813 [Cichorium intybus]